MASEIKHMGSLVMPFLVPESHSEKGLDSLAVLSCTHTTKFFYPQERLFSLNHGFSTEFFRRVRWLTFSLHAPTGQRY